MRRFLLLLMAFTLIGVACGGDDSSSSDEEVRAPPTVADESGVATATANTAATTLETDDPTREETQSSTTSAGDINLATLSTLVVRGEYDHLAPRRWISGSDMEPRIAVTFDVDGWRAMDIGCNGLLDYAEFTHYPDFRNSAKMHLGPIHQDCTFHELIADLPPMASEPVEVLVGVDRWDALQYVESSPDWSYLGVRMGPNNLGAGHLYLINGDERNYFAFITAPTGIFDEFAALTNPILASLELDVGD